jgi:hypothetical protein
VLDYNGSLYEVLISSHQKYFYPIKHLMGAVLPILMFVDFSEIRKQRKRNQNTKEKQDGMSSIMKSED